MQIQPISIHEVDVEKVQQVAKAAFLDTPDSSLDEWFSFAEMKIAIEDNRGVCLKAENDEGKVVGMIYAQQESPINGKEGVEKWVIVITAIDPKFSGQGIGSALLNGIEKEASSRNVKKLFVFTNMGERQAIEFYKKNDYVDAGWIKDYQYGKDNSAVFLLKYLPSAT